MMGVEPEQQITDPAQLRTVYREPAQVALNKVIHHIDDGAAGFIASSPFVVLSTATDSRADASPRGGPPGFVRVLDRHRIAWGDLTGNNRLDSFGNLLEQPNVGLLFMVPGVEETLRMNGSAQLVQDAEVLEACVIDGRVPKTAVVITVRECYIQCGAALRRSELWNPATWPDVEARPSGAAILKAHLDSPVTAQQIAAGLAEYYDNHIWVAGGRHD
jgi:PPOX class probable FMN-dependent enzyme